jgi:hypothetical protein
VPQRHTSKGSFRRDWGARNIASRNQTDPQTLHVRG